MTRKVACGLCGDDFECEGAPGCWCSEVNVDSNHLKSISLRATDCVCAGCLTATGDWNAVSIRP
jgi:hypothetical protein